MRTCPRCGALLEDSMNFCPQCHQSVVQTANNVYTNALPGNAPFSTRQNFSQATRRGKNIPEVISPAIVPIKEFSTVGCVLLGIFVPLFKPIKLRLFHSVLPKRRLDDPSGAKAFWFYFIPFFNVYWVFFEPLRLVDRVNDELAEYDLQEYYLSKGLVITMLLMEILLPILGIIVGEILSLVFLGLVQSRVNMIARAKSGKIG